MLQGRAGRAVAVAVVVADQLFRAGGGCGFNQTPGAIIETSSGHTETKELALNANKVRPDPSLR
jgi:hypothetical protein